MKTKIEDYNGVSIVARGITFKGIADGAKYTLRAAAQTWDRVDTYSVINRKGRAVLRIDAYQVRRMLEQCQNGDHNGFQKVQEH